MVSNSHPADPSCFSGSGKMEAAGSILEKEEWLDFLPTKTLENPLNVAAEVGIAIIKFLYIKSELENWPTF